MKGFWSNGLSIRESKVSSQILFLGMSLTFIFTMFFLDKDISSLVPIIITQITGVGATAIGTEFASRNNFSSNSDEPMI
jgi:hypothetical protein